MPTSADLLLDTSAALALLHQHNPAHAKVVDLANGLTLGLAGHALIETFSVLTRLPGDARVSPGRARQMIEHTFPKSVTLPPEAGSRALSHFTEAGIAGGAVYDGLIGLAAREAGLVLLSCDRRALGIYAALKVEVRLV